jgi:hypothetical protein
LAAGLRPFTGTAADASPIVKLEPSKASATAVILRLVTTTPPISELETSPPSRSFTHPPWLKAEDVVGKC